MSLGTTKLGEPLLFGWDDQTWQRAFVWAGIKQGERLRVINSENLTGDQWALLTRVHALWMEKNGDPEGPKGRIIL